MVLGLASKSDATLYNDNADDFIPVICHYDAHTLMTKNGHLLQTIHIHGLGAETVSKELLNLRQIVRNAIKEHVKSDDISFWVHTLRRKKDLDDKTPYPNDFSGMVHDLWRKKNFWHDKFVNSLYITVVHTQARMPLKSIQNVIGSFYKKKVQELNEAHLAKAASTLSELTNNLTKSMASLGAVRLSITFEGDKVFSQPLYLYKRIVHLSEEKSYIDTQDLSKTLGTHRYAVGSNKLEVTDGITRKFAAMLSFREYHELSAGSLDKFLQLPVEMIATEIFHFTDQAEARAPHKHSNYILTVSRDEELREVKGLTALFAETDYASAFCNQQISVTIMSDSTAKLDSDIAQVSKALSKVGIAHVREDINLESAFWAQLPGNFTFLTRISPSFMDATCALTSLHNFPTGSQDSLWGAAVTLLRTEKGTPFFMHFHDNNNIGHTCIFGHNKSGKTVTTNFFLSEAQKKKPAVLYISTDAASRIFVEATGGVWADIPPAIEPLSLFRLYNAPAKFKAFIDILINHTVLPEGSTAVQNFIDAIWAQKDITNFVDACTKWVADEKDEGQKILKENLTRICALEHISRLFGANNDTLLAPAAEKITAYNMHLLKQQKFYEEFYKEDKKYQPVFAEKIRDFDGLRAAYIYSLLHFFVDNPAIVNAKKIYVYENLHEFFTNRQFITHINSLYKELNVKNGILLSNVNMNEIATDPMNVLLPTIRDALYEQWLGAQATQIILTSDVYVSNFAQMMHLSEVELEKIKSLSPNSRLFIIKQSASSIAVELSLGGFKWLLRILSCSERDLEEMTKLQQHFGPALKSWLPELYNILKSSA